MIRPHGRSIHISAEIVHSFVYFNVLVAIMIARGGKIHQAEFGVSIPLIYLKKFERSYHIAQIKTECKGNSAFRKEKGSCYYYRSYLSFRKCYNLQTDHDT